MTGCEEFGLKGDVNAAGDNAFSFFNYPLRDSTKEQILSQFAFCLFRPWSFKFETTLGLSCMCHDTLS